jgi:dihydropyrimidinase
MSGDLRVRGERIEALGPNLHPEQGEAVLDAAGLYVLPGVIDPHTHFAMDTGTGRSAEDFQTGSASAAAGGVTSYVNFAVQRPGLSFDQAVEAVRTEAEGHSHVDFGIHLNVTRLDPGWEADLERVVDQGVSSAKVYTTYKGTVFYADDWVIYRLMERSGPSGLLVQMHAENDDMLAGRRRELVASGMTSIAFHGESRPPVAESEAVARGLFLSRATGSPIYFVHLTNPLSVDLVAEARAAGQTALAETCPHFLCLDDSVYAGSEAKRYLMTPPIRSRELQAGLWERLSAGRFDSIGSDHCGYSLEQRGNPESFTEVPSPGIPGTETTLPLLYTFGVRAGRLDMSGLVRLLSEGPARIFGLWPRKGALRVGADADLVLFDPAAAGPLREDELHSAAGYSPYEGLELAGRVRTTLCRGRVVFDTGRVLGDPKWGHFLERRPFEAANLG